MIDVKLSDSGIEGAGIFHNLQYTNDRYNGNQNKMTFEIINASGNDIEAEITLSVYDQKTKKYRKDVHKLESLYGIKLTIKGALEHSDFLNMLQLILEAEKMVDIIKP
jgi:hypothetical protein